MRPILLALLLGLGAIATGASAQDAFPSRPIRLIVPYPPGGTADAMARALGQELTAAWGQPVVIDNRPGASTMIGARRRRALAARRLHAAVRHRLDAHHHPKLFTRLPYDPRQGLRADHPDRLSRICVLVVNPSVPARTLEEFVALAKAKPGTLNYGSFGSGSQPHLIDGDVRSSSPASR